MTAPPAESFVKNRKGRHYSGYEVEFSGAHQRQRGRQHQKKHRCAEEMLRREWLRRSCDGGSHRLNLQDNIQAGARDFVGA
jgi:hypothetical protein